jgi:hypothetical protein
MIIQVRYREQGWMSQGLAVDIFPAKCAWSKFGEFSALLS